MDDKRLTELENMNEGAVFPDKLYRELLTEIRILRGIKRSLEETNKETKLQLRDAEKEMDRLRSLSEADPALVHALTKERDAANRLNEAMRKALYSVRDQLSLMMTPGVAIAKITVSGCIDDIDEVFAEKPVEEAPKRCDSYWDGNQCEGPDGHDGKHCWMGWSWVVSPPPLTEETPTEKRKDLVQKGCMARSPGHIMAGTLTCSGKDGHDGRHSTYSNGVVYGWD